MRGASLGVIAGAAAAAIVVACARAPQPAGAMPVAPRVNSAGAPPQAMPGGDAHARIQHLADEIAAKSQQDALPAVAAHANPPEGDCKPTCMIEQMSVAPHAQDAACHPAHTQACDDACTLSDAICDDATQICDLAKQLATDAWAAGKCSDAQASCTAAHDRCCGCQ